MTSKQNLVQYANDLISKSLDIMKAIDKTKLQKKIIVNKKGNKQTVWVRPGDQENQKTAHPDSQEKNQDKNEQSLLQSISNSPRDDKDYSARPSAIMNANMWISGKNTIDHIAKEDGGNSTILVCLKDDSQKIFILGAQGDYGKSGKMSRYVIDTGNGYRGGQNLFKIQNVIHVNKDGSKKSENSIGMNEKRQLYVFK